MLLRRMLSRRWILTTLLVVAGTLVLIRLGVWQLDRLAERRADNAHYAEMLSLPPLNLNAEIPSQLGEMEYRAATATGTYDFENQIAVRNQVHRDQYGYHLLTPLRFESPTGAGETAVFVDRGWIPLEGNATPTAWRKYDAPESVEISGVIRLGQSKPAFGGIADALPLDGSKLEIWNNADLAMIADQMPYPVLKIYVQLDEAIQNETPPISSAPEFEATEGPHFGYALQWFVFAAILFFGYPFFLRKQDVDSP
ncbi:MAG: SURF1 family protein [Anaerolineales bacterium]|nr:SURF1 family protein [Anaerolineales bacterium]